VNNPVQYYTTYYNRAQYGDTLFTVRAASVQRFCSCCKSINSSHPSLTANRKVANEPGNFCTPCLHLVVSVAAQTRRLIHILVTFFTTCRSTETWNRHAYASHSHSLVHRLIH